MVLTFIWIWLGYLANSIPKHKSAFKGSDYINSSHNRQSFLHLQRVVCPCVAVHVDPSHIHMRACGTLCMFVDKGAFLSDAKWSQVHVPTMQETNQQNALCAGIYKNTYPHSHSKGRACNNSQNRTTLHPFSEKATSVIS